MLPFPLRSRSTRAEPHTAAILTLHSTVPLATVDWIRDGHLTHTEPIRLDLELGQRHQSDSAEGLSQQTTHLRVKFA